MDASGIELKLYDIPVIVFAADVVTYVLVVAVTIFFSLHVTFFFL